MKREFILLILIVGALLFLGGLEIFLKEKPSEPEFTNQSPKVETRGVGTGCGIAVAEMFFYFSDPDPGDYLTAYQLQIDDNSDFSHCPSLFRNLKNSEIKTWGEDCLFDTDKESNIKETLVQYDSTYKFSLTQGLPEGIYYWRVRAWDKKDAESGWAKATLDLTR